MRDSGSVGRPAQFGKGKRFTCDMVGRNDNTRHRSGSRRGGARHNNARHRSWQQSKAEEAWVFRATGMRHTLEIVSSGEYRH